MHVQKIKNCLCTLDPHFWTIHNKNKLPQHSCHGSSMVVSTSIMIGGNSLVMCVIFHTTLNHKTIKRPLFICFRGTWSVLHFGSHFLRCNFCSYIMLTKEVGDTNSSDPVYPSVCSGNVLLVHTKCQYLRFYEMR